MKKIYLLFVMLMVIPAVAGLDYYHGQTCERPDGVKASISIENKPLIGRKEVNLYDFETVKTKIKNTGTYTGNVVCEVGVYKEDEVNSWHGLFSVGAWEELTGNCIEDEAHVITKRIYLQPGQEEEVEYSVYIPPEYPLGSDYVIHAACFNHCYLCSPNDFEWYDYDVMKIRIDSEVTPPAPVDHCENFYKDKDETDIDCGGSCEDCLEGQKCKADADCSTGFCSSDARCRPESDRPSGEQGQQLL